MQTHNPAADIEEKLFGASPLYESSMYNHTPKHSEPMPKSWNNYFTTFNIFYRKIMLYTKNQNLLSVRIGIKAVTPTFFNGGA